MKLFLRAKFVLISFSYLLMISACYGIDKKKEYRPLVGVECKLSGEVSGVFKIMYASDSLVILKSKGHCLMSVGHMATEDSVFFIPIARRGRGPYEFQYVVPEVYEDSLYLVENQGMMHSMTSVPLMSLDSTMTWSEYDLKDLDRITMRSFCHLDKERLLLLGGEFDENELITIVDIYSHDTKAISFWPEDGFRGSTIVKQQAYLRNSKIHYHDRRILYVAGEGRYAELLYLDNNDAIKDRKSIYHIAPDYLDRGDGLNPSIVRGAPRGISSYVSNNRIYLLVHNWVTSQDGQTLPQEYKGYPSTYDDRIEVYDWDGKLINAYQTDIPFGSFAVTPNDSTLFTLTQDMLSGEARIRRYNLY
jgi:hypothetical protein